LAVYQIDVEKVLGTEFWSNTYHVDVADLATAQARRSSIVLAERNFLNTPITIIRSRVRLAGPGHVGTVNGENGVGVKAWGGAKLPLFNCMRVDFVNGTARPARKYLRCGFAVSNVGSDFTFDSGTVADGNTYAAAILAIVGICDPQGRPLTGGNAQARVAMHQLRRGNKRKPILTP
jgi:hypothetical protein